MFKWVFAAGVALVVTVNAAPVEQLWERRYNGQASREDVFSALTVDVGGRVYVTGSSDNNVNPDPYGTVKYDTNGTRLWEARYTGPRAIDVPLSVIVDGQGYVYVTGFSHGFASGYDPDYATIKYAPEGTELWVARYNGAGTNYQSPDNPMAMLVNAAGEVYVTGTSMSPQQTLDFATIKYAPNGTELWIARYQGPAGYSDRATAMGIDGAGNIYVCGSSEREDYKARVTLLKYSPTGTQLWEAHFDTSEEAHELVPQMKVDPSGKAHIAFTTRRGSQQDVRRLIALQYNSEGELVWRTQHRLFIGQYGIDVVAVDLDDTGNMCAAVRGVGSYYYDYLVWKVSAAGESLWTSRYNTPSGYQDVVGGMALDVEGNIYVTGTTYTSGNHYQFTTIKLRPNGQREWETTTAHSDNFGLSLSGVRVDAAGHVYVGGSVGPVGTKDYVTIKYRQLPQPGLPEITAHPVAQSTTEGGSAAFSVTATGEGLEYQWRRDGFPISDATNNTLILTNIGGGARGYYYVEVSNSGGTVASTEALLDVILAPQIVEQPVSQQVIAGAAAEFSVMVTGSEPLSFQWSRGGTAIAGATNSVLVISNVQPADAASYSVVVTNIAGSATSESAMLSLVPGLEQLFVGTFRQPGQGYGFPQFLRVGTDGKAHLAQMLQLANQADFLTVQFDTNGAPTWSARYALGTNRANYLSAAEMDRSNNVYVAGTGGENYRWLTVVKYGPAGNQLWAAAHDTTRTNTYDSVAGMAVDAAGNVYVTGGTESQQIQRDFLTVKFDANGVEQWALRYTQSDSSSDAASAIQVDASGVYVFGVSYQETARLVTVKYDHAGTLLWTRNYNCNSGQATAMKLDAAGNVIVTGSAVQSDGDSDFVTLKYSPGGDVLWISQFTGMTDAYDYPYGLDIDAAGNIYVAGRSSLPNEENTGLSAFSVVKYDASGIQLWVSSEIAGASEGGVDSFAVDAAGSAYRVLGKYREESGSDFVTAKFDTNGTRLWEAISTRGKYSDEYPGALAVTEGGDLLISGISYNPVSELLLFRYRQSEIVGLPVITESPRSRDVTAGASVTFSVTATGTGLSYQWYFNGRAIGGATSPSYTVTSAAERNSGFYAVEVRNAVGSVLSATAILSIGVPPEITQQPYSQTVLPGADVVFEVSASGSRPLSYQWRHNGTNIPGALSARLELVSAQLESGGLYSVVASNRAGVATSANALLTVTSQARREWLASFTNGAPARSYPTDMELDSAENVYVGGWWEITGAPPGYLTAKFSSAGEQLWARRFSTNDSASYASSIAVDLVGNVYTVGNSTISNVVRGVVTVKYDANGNQLWARHFARPGQTPMAQDITLSLGGNIYVAASFDANLSSGGSLVTVGYDTNGVQLWSASQTLDGNDASETCKVTAHSDAEVYAVGQTWDQSTGRDVIAIRYNATGTQVWNRRVADVGNQGLVDTKIDAAGDLVVLAHSNGGYTTNRGFLTLKVRSTDGETLWRRAYSLLEYGSDEPFALEVDYTRNIYVTGKTFIRSYYDEYGQHHQDDDVLTLKYSPTGELLWVATYGAPAGHEDVGRAIAWDGSEGLYITGRVGAQYGYGDWLTLRYDTDGNRYWSDIHNGPDGADDCGVAVRVRGTNAYVVGRVSHIDQRVGLIKYTDVGTADVPKITTGPQSQTAIAGNNVTFSVVATGPGPLRYQWYYDDSPIIGATGSSVLLPQVETTNAGNYSVEISNIGGVVVSRNALLNVVIPARIVVGPEDQCVVAGSHVQFRAQVEGDGDVGINWFFNGAPISANYYYLTITNASAANAGLYTVVATNLYGSATASARLTISPQAALAWSARYNYTNSSYDLPEAAVVNSQGNTYILGNSGRGSVLLKYESTGALAWERWNVRTSYIMFAATELALAPDGAVYAAGWVQGPMENAHLLTLVKYSPNGDQLWDAEYSAVDFPRPVDMKVDAAGNVYITAEIGEDRYTPSQILTLKYDADGNRLWARRLDYSPDGPDLPVALAVDPAGNVYVTGYSLEPDAIAYARVANYLTVKYDTAGNQLWTAEHSGPGGADDRPTAIAVDAQGNVYVTGSHSAEYWVNSGTTVYFDYDYATIKYDTDGNQAWLAVYNSAPRQPDMAADLKVDGAGNVYVIGQSDGDIVTVKYNAAGEQQWVTGFDSGFDYDVAVRLVLDDLGNAYVTGQSGDWGDILTCKLDANGSRIWVARFDGRQPAHGSGGSHDFPIAIGLDAARNVYVAGAVDSPITGRDFIVIRYTVTNSPGSPVITVPPQDTTVSFGATATLSVTATGDAPLRYQWRRNGIALANETNATLQIPEVTFADAAQYSVVVHNNIDFTVSAEAALIVVMPEMVQCVHVEPTGNGVRLIVAGPAACTYRVECTADFVTWNALGTVYNHNGTCEYLDTTPTSSRRFYRVVKLPH